MGQGIDDSILVMFQIPEGIGGNLTFKEPKINVKVLIYYVV